MTSKLRVAILFGGHSAEHEVSLQSAKKFLKQQEGDRWARIRKLQRSY